MNHVAANGRDDCPASLILDQFLSGSLHAEHQERINRHVESLSSMRGEDRCERR